MKVLVTGATGFLGGWLVRQLVQEQHDVRIIQRNPDRSVSDLEGLAELPIEIVSADITDPASMDRACDGVDTVFHLAGLVAYSRAQRPLMEKVNVQGTANVVNSCAKTKVRRLVHMSSVVAIGASFDGKPLNEDSPYNVKHLDLGYFETKHAAENIVREANQTGRVDAVMVNPGTIYGPGDAKKGSRGVQLKVARGKFPFYPPGGVNIVSVEDVVDCTIAAWKRGRSGERYIVGGENLLIRDVFKMIASEAGVEPPSIPLPRPLIFTIGKVGDLLESIGKKGPLNTENAWTSVLYHWFDSSKAQRELGLSPKPASFAIAQSVKWIKENGLLHR